MQKIAIVLSIVILILISVAFIQGGTELVLQAFQVALYRLGSVVFLVVAAYLISGFAQVLLSPEKIYRWLGPGAGIKGVVSVLIAGAVTPGGPYVFYPIASSLSKAGAKKPLIIIYLASKMLWDIWRIPIELALLGSFLTIVRWQATFFIPVIIAMVVLIGYTLTRAEDKEAASDC